MLILCLLGLAVLLVGVTAGLILAKRQKLIGTLTCMGSIVIAAVLIVLSSLRTVPTGHTGIVTTFGNVEDYTYEAGVHFALPWCRVINMDNRNQKQSVPLSCFSSDIQEVDVTYTINYQINKSNAQTIYKTIGTSYYDTVIYPRVQEAVKSVIAQYDAETLLEKRAQLSEEIKVILTEKLAAYNIEVLDTSLENLDFSDAFTDAVEAKQVAAQKKQQAQIEQEQKTMEAEEAAKRATIEAEASAQVAIIAAQADLDVVKIQADAAEYAGQKDAAVIGQVRDILAADSENLTTEDIQNLLLYYYIQKWSGSLPETYVSAEDFYSMLAGLALSAKADSTVNAEQNAVDMPTVAETAE